MNPFDRYTYTFNYDTSELEIPSVFLLTKRLKKIGILNNITDLKISLNALDPNEISFSLYKYYNDELEEHYSSIINQSVIWVSGFGCFELQVNESDNENGVFKSVSGKSLPHCELSQIQVSLEVNTDDDILRLDKEKYINDFPTVFYRDIDTGAENENYWSSYKQLNIAERKEILKKSSLLHRLLSYAPHYEIGHIDETLYFVQREFSFDGDLLDCLSKIQEEINCIFTFDCYLDDDGTAIRRINAYDVCYCKKCYEDHHNSNYKTFNVGKYRSVVNGICTNCNSADYVYDYGEDTDIFITTENLTNEIQVQPENEVKNCFKVSGGDDAINSVVSRLQMTASNKIYHFSESQKKQMSEELSAAITRYEEEYNDEENQKYFVSLVNTEYNLFDLIGYLKHEKMPTTQIDDKKGIQEEVDNVLSSIKNDFQCQFYVSSYDNGSETSFKNHEYTCASTAIKNLFTLYMDKGYGVSINTTDFSKKDSTGKVRWYGEIKLYEVDDRNNNYAKIKVEPERVTTVEYGAIVAEESNEHFIEKKEGFKVEFSFGDTGDAEYKKYIEQYCETSLASYKEIEYKNREDKDWGLYCYERLRSYHDGYQACLDALDQMWNTATGAQQDILTEIRTIYSSIQEKIEHQMYVLQCQINALSKLNGIYPDEDSTDYVDYVYEDFEYDFEELGLTESSEEDDFIVVLKDAANKTSRNYIGDKPFSCKKCGSELVATAIRDDGSKYNYCKNCKTSDQDKIVTYATILNEVIKFINNNTHDGFVTKYYLPFIGENVYGNYITPSIQDYKIITKDDDKHSLIYSYSSNSVEPLYYIKTPNYNASFKDTNTDEYDLLIENNGSQELRIVVSHESAQGGWIKMSEDTVGVGDICRCSTAMPHFQNNIYKIKIDLVEEEPRMSTGVKATVYKCYDPKGDMVQISSVKDLDANNLKGMNVWCSYQTNNAFDIKYEAITIDSVQDLIAKVMEYFSIKRYLGEDLYKELMLYIREDKYENQNYSSDGCNTNTGLIEKAQALIIKAKQELVKASEQQYTISSSVYSILSTKYSNWYDGENRSYLHDEFEKFKLGNWIRVRLDDTNYDGNTADDNLYKMRLQSIELDFENIDNTSVTYSNVMKYTSDIYTKISDAIGSMSSMATSYSYVSTQAEEGEQASKKINNILKNGYDSALAAIKAGDNQDIIMDRHGLLFREYLPDINDYSKYQMKMINRNIVMTSDNWDTASLAIGLGRLSNGDMGYGIWADNIIAGKINVTEDLTIGNEDESVQITKGGIILDGGAITWKEKKYPTLPQDSIEGLPSKLQGLDEYLEQLDGRVQSYSQIDDPSTEWRTSDEKDKHKGDLWFNPSDGQTKRWNGTKWTVVTDSELVKLAQSKGQVFTTVPTPPYNIGDIWLGNDKSDLLVCKTAKTKDQEFDIADWEKGVKYTDDTALNTWKDDFTNKIMPELQEQIDGKIDTFYQSTVPTWNPKDNEKHKGDLWYNTSSTDISQGSNTFASNTTYRWSGTSWEQSSPIPQDLYDAIDGVASIYSTLPDKPQDNDVLIPVNDIKDGEKTYYARKVYRYNIASKTWNEIKYTDDSKIDKFLADDGEYYTTLSIINEQNDKKAETWYGSNDPTTLSTWDSDKNHDGDLWYNESIQKSYMYKNGSWKDFKSDIPQEMFDKFDGNKAVYTSAPTTYYVNDLYILEQDRNYTVGSETKTWKKGTILTANKNGKNVSSFNSSDWNELVRYTNDDALNKWMQDFTNNIRPAIESQIDGKADTWYSSADPSISWTDDDKKNHIGDLWYKTVADGNGKYHTYIYNSSYKWEEVNGVPKEVFDMADGKSSIYISKPTNGYDEGDFWILSENDIKEFDGTYLKNTMLATTESRGENEFEKTDWIPVTTKSAQDALSKFSDIGSDNLITPTEKQQIKLMFKNITADKISIDKQCEKYSIDADKDSKDNKEIVYYSYLETYNSLNNMVNSLLSNMKDNSDKPSNYDTLFSGYYNAYENMIEKIEEASKGYASSIVGALRTDLKSQIDGKIQTYYQDTVPTWDEKDNDSHSGDLWFNTSESNITYNGVTYKAKTNYRFNGTWQISSIVPKDVYDKIDGVASIYDTIPSSPQTNDILFPNADIKVNSVTYKKGKMYKYNGSSWIESSYTDDTAINSMITAMSSDNIISVAEKADLGKVMKTITNEYNSTKTKADTYKLWDTFTGYHTAYGNLSDYINNLLSKRNEDSNIDKSTYDRYFSEYYKELGVANNLINLEIQKAAESTASEALSDYKEEVSAFQTKVNDCLGVTEITKDSVISPKIGGGYAYFTKGDYSVEIDPSHGAGDNTSNNYLFCIRNKVGGELDEKEILKSNEYTFYFQGEFDRLISDVVTYAYDIPSGVKKIRIVTHVTKDYNKYTFTNDSTGAIISYQTTPYNGYFDNYVDVPSGATNVYISSSDLSMTKVYYKTTSEKVIMGVDINGNGKFSGTVDAKSGYIGSFSITNEGLTKVVNDCGRASITNFLIPTGGAPGFFTSSYDSSDYIYNDSPYCVSYRGRTDYGVNNGATFQVKYSMKWDGVNCKNGNYTIEATKGDNSKSYDVVINAKTFKVNGTTVSSDMRLKKDFKTLEEYEKMFVDLKPISYKYITGTSDRKHIGFIAQDVKKSLDNNNLTTKDFAGYVESESQSDYYKEKLGYIPEGLEETELGLRYEEFIALNTHMIQKSIKRIHELEERIKKLEDK